MWSFDFLWESLGYPQPFCRFTSRSRKVMALSNQMALAAGREEIQTEDLLAGLLREGSGAGVHFLKQQGVDLHKLMAEVSPGKLEANATDGPKLRLAPLTKSVIKAMIHESQAAKDNYAGTEHLVLALMTAAPAVRGMLEQAGAREDIFRDAMQALRDKVNESPDAV